NVVLSRRPDAERPDAGRAGRSSDAPGTMTATRDNPSLDDIADAVVRATTRVTGSSPWRPDANVGAPDAGGAAPRGGAREQERTPDSTAAIPPTGTTHRLTEGTLI